MIVVEYKHDDCFWIQTRWSLSNTNTMIVVEYKHDDCCRIQTWWMLLNTNTMIVVEYKHDECCWIQTRWLLLNTNTFTHITKIVIQSNRNSFELLFFLIVTVPLLPHPTHATSSHVPVCHVTTAFGVVVLLIYINSQSTLMRPPAPRIIPTNCRCPTPSPAIAHGLILRSHCAGHAYPGIKY